LIFGFRKKYRSKIEIAQALIVAAKEMGFDFVALDGAFSYPKMFDFYKKNKQLKLSMRIAKSRLIETKNGVKAHIPHF